MPNPYLITADHDDSYVASSLARLGEAILATNPRTYMQLLSYTNVGYYLIQNNRFILATVRLANMLGFTMEELLNTRPLELVSPADRDMVKKLTDEQCWEENQPCRCTCRLVGKNGNSIVAQIENMPIKVAAQRAYHGLIINVNDFTDPEEYLPQSDDTFRWIMDSVNDGWVVCDCVSGRILDVNAKIIEIFGYSREELSEISIYRLALPDDDFNQHKLMTVIDMVKKVEPQIINWPLRRKDKTVIWINANLIYTVIREQEVILITLRDVTELLAVTNQLRQSEERFKLAASLATDLIYEENAITGELCWYGDIDKLLGYKEGAFPRTTKAWRQVIAPEMLAAVQQEIDRCTAKGEPYQLEYQVLKSDGQHAWVSERGKKLVDAAGKIVRRIGTITNINELKKVNQELQQKEERYRLLTENARDIIFSIQISPKLKVEYFSPALTLITGYKPEDFYDNPQLIRRLVGPGHPELLDLIRDNKINLDNTWRASWRNKDGKIIWTEQNTTVFDYGYRKVIQGVARDITENKIMEDKLRYLTSHDTLTGLMNRLSFEERLADIRDDEASYSLIMFDVDGLKLINDTMGHQVGDSLLQAAGKIIRQACPWGQMLARIGGDEFAVLLAGDDLPVILDIITNIKDAVNEYNGMMSSFLSLSMGYAISGTESTNNLNLFAEADNDMYRQKLLNSQSIRNSIIRGLTYTLKARDLETEDHGERIQSLVLALARAIPLAENRMNDLILLSQFHDIGKVGIPDQILFKPGILNAGEFETMKRHSEIGYRIAQSVDDLVTVSDWILKHHEWWNGAGYPLGLKGEEIPIECRILSIADAYDAMTNDRPYRQAMSRQMAIEELKSGAGSQFDPQLVEMFIDLV